MNTVQYPFFTVAGSLLVLFVFAHKSSGQYSELMATETDVGVHVVVVDYPVDTANSALIKGIFGSSLILRVRSTVAPFTAHLPPD